MSGVVGATERWNSRHTGVDMPLVRFGRRGPVLIYVPSSSGDETEFERYGMAAVCRPWIEAGRLQVVSIDGLARKGLWNDELDPRERIVRHAAFERYAVEELLPWVADRIDRAPPALVGASYGAFVAANVWLKYPGRVGLVCGLGGVYGLWHRLDGFHDDTVYFHTPLEYLPRLEDPTILASIRATRGMMLFAAERDEWCWSTERMVDVLRRKGLPHEVELWPSPANHHERWWRKQLGRFLERFY